MDQEQISLEEKCENLMNIVVESRKRFGKMSVDYDQKNHIIENKMLNLQIDTISNFHFKSKTNAPKVDVDNLNKEVEDFASEVMSVQRKKENLKKQLKNMHNVVLQLQKDTISKKAREPFTVDAMLMRAKKKAS